MKRSERDAKLLRKLFQQAEDGVSLDLPGEKDAVNLRQKIYAYKRDILANSRSEPLKDIASRIKVEVDGQSLHISTKLPDYMGSVEEQLDD